MLSIVFWNLKKLKRAKLIAQLVRDTSADVVLLAECIDDNDDLIDELKSSSQKLFTNAHPLSTRVRIYSGLPEASVEPLEVSNVGRLAIQKLTCGKLDCLLAAVHLPSKINNSDADQLQFAQQVSESIRHLENKHKHQRTILVGDLNMNPFDPGVVGAYAFHGVMTRTIAIDRARTLHDREHPYFYNPMWNLLGDETPGPPGTHYIRLGRPLEYFWNMYDQVLIRPDLLQYFQKNPCVVVEIGGEPLLSKSGLPNEKIGSDHLPLFFQLTTE